MNENEDENKSVFENRADNLNHIIKTEFNGSVEAFSEDLAEKGLKLKPETIRKFLSPQSKRPCGDRRARDIEMALGKKQLSLDYEFRKYREVYYIAIITASHYKYEIITRLQAESTVVECSAVLGDFDIILKVVTRSFESLGALTSRISRIPGVQRSTTYSTIRPLRWQRAQAENMYIPKPEDSFHSNGLEKFIHMKMKQFYDEMKGLDNDSIIVKDSDVAKLEDHDLLYGAQRRVFAIKEPFESSSHDETYLEEERKLVESSVDFRRIILLDKDSQNKWQKIRRIFNTLNTVGGEHRFLFKTYWIPTLLSDTPEVFIVVDEAFVCIKRATAAMKVFKKDPQVIESYAKAFEANWARALKVEEVEKSFA